MTAVEPFHWVDGDWRGPRDTGGVSVFVSGIDARPDGMMFARALPPALRARLDEPDAVIVDRADLDSLGVSVGDTATINGHRVRVVGVSSGLRALGGVNVVASLDTARQLDTDPSNANRMTYFVAKLRDPDQPQLMSPHDCAATVPSAIYDVWTAQDFARRSQLYWMFDTGAGAGVLFLAGIVFLVGAVITSQTLVAAVIGSIREYATLNALGVGVGDIAQGGDGTGVLGRCHRALSAVRCLVASPWCSHAARSVPVALDPWTALACLVVGMGLATVSGLAAMRSLRRADPATLLR